jgi:uncharacterized protein YigE (DUF2233 family)
VREERLELFLHDEAGKGLKSFPAIDTWLGTKGRKLVFAMNAGMFHPDWSPVGLFISEGREVKALNTDSAPGNFFLKPNGVFAITDAGAHVIETSEYPKLAGKVRLATQSGPLLVQRGKLHPAFNAGSQSRLYRNGVGVPNAGTAFFAISEDPINFHEFARFFRDVLRCPDALFLDGDICSLYSPELKRSDWKIDLGPVIGISAPR